MADGSARLFLAIWPDDAVRLLLCRHRDAWRWPPEARPVPDANLHLTLHFIGAFPRDGIDALGKVLATVPAPSITLRSDADEVWHGGIAVLRLADDGALTTLHRRLGDALAALAVPLDPRPFSPHVTLARKARGAVRPGAPVELDWAAHDFVLVESRPGRQAPYAVLRRFGGAAS